jgi:hypothetical protein
MYMGWKLGPGCDRLTLGVIGQPLHQHGGHADPMRGL